MRKEYQTVSNIVGPLVLVEKVADVKYGELVEIETAGGRRRRGQVLDISTEQALVQVFEGTVGLDVQGSRVRFLGRSQQLGVVRGHPRPHLRRLREAHRRRAADHRPRRCSTSTAARSIPTPATIPPSSSRPASRPSTA